MIGQELGKTGHEPNPDLPDGFQMTELGPLPKEWRVVRLGEVVDVKGGKRLPKGDEFASNPTPYPYIRIVDFKNGSVDIRNLKFLTEEQHILLSRYIITSNDVYISIAGTIGLVGSVPEELNGAHLTENAARLILNTNRLYRQFLVFALQSDMVQAQIQARATKTSQPKLALARIKEIPIPLPPSPSSAPLPTYCGRCSGRRRRRRASSPRSRN
jgi:restriction endonuclease S subunit